MTIANEMKLSETIASVERENIRAGVADMFQKALDSHMFGVDLNTYTGLINVSPMFTVVSKGGKAEFNWTCFDKVIRTAVRFMDNVIEIMQREGRVFSLDITGHNLVMDILATPENEQFTFIEMIRSYVRIVSADASIVLAMEKNPFEDYDFETFRKSTSYDILSPELKSQVKLYGIRNEVIDITITPDEVIV